MRKNLSLKPGLDIDQYIQVEEIKDKHERIIFRFIRFNLNQKSLKTILQAKSFGNQLKISTNLKAQLVYCSLSDGENWYKESRFQSGLTFCTYYDAVSQSANSKPRSIAMKSVISPDGDIMHQIRRDCIEYPETGKAIASAHYWVLEQLLNQLRIKKIDFSLKWLPAVLSLLVVAVIVIIGTITNLTPINPLTLLAMIVMWWLFQEGFKRLLKLFLPSLHRLAGRQFLSRLLSSNIKDKKTAKEMLKRLVD